MKELETKYNCQMIKNSINEKSGMFAEFVARCLDDEEFEKTMNELFPFDNVAQAKRFCVNLGGDSSPILGLHISSWL